LRLKIFHKNQLSQKNEKIFQKKIYFMLFLSTSLNLYSAHYPMDTIFAAVVAWLPVDDALNLRLVKKDFTFFYDYLLNCVCNVRILQTKFGTRQAKRFPSLFVGIKKKEDLKIFKKMDADVLKLVSVSIKKVNADGVTNLRYVKNLDLSSSLTKTLPTLGRYTRSLNLYDTGVSDITPLRKCKNLEVLNLSHTKVPNLDTLQHLTSLKKLYAESVNGLPKPGRAKRGEKIDYAKYVDQFQAIGKLTKLRVLNLSGNNSRTTDISWLASLVDLQELNLSNTCVSDVNVISNMKNLNTLNLSNNRYLNSIDALKDLTKLKEVNLSHCENDIDVTPIRHVHILHIAGCSEDNIKQIAKFKNLHMLNIAESTITDISPLRKLTKLTHLDISCTDVEDITPLDKCKSLETLNIEGTNVDIDELDDVLEECSHLSKVDIIVE
jgi:hypothetical protein